MGARERCGDDADRGRREPAVSAADAGVDADVGAGESGKLRGNDARSTVGAARARADAAREVLVVAAIVVVGALVLYAVGIGCPIKFLTGVSCPGCGLTRAWLEALQGRIDRAVAYHPLFWAVPVAVALGVLQPRVRGRWCTVALSALVAAFLLLWVVRLVMPNDLALFVDAAGTGDVVSLSQPGWLSWLRSAASGIGA